MKELIETGAAIAGMSINDDARDYIALLSQGLPHYTHLLSLNAFIQATETDSATVRMEDVRAAIKKSLKQAQQSVVNAYHKAVTSPRKENLYAQVLLACAVASTDSLGYFYAGDVREPMTNIMKRPYDIPAFSQHLNAFCEDERGPILRRAGTKRKYRFRFVNPLMQPYVYMHGVDSGMIGGEGGAMTSQTPLL